MVVDEGAGKGIQTISRLRRVFRTRDLGIRLEYVLGSIYSTMYGPLRGRFLISFLILGARLGAGSVVANKWPPFKR